MRVGLTGGIATGKSHVRAAFESLGVPTIDADILARDAVAPATPGLAAVVERFGRDVLGPDGSLDRRRLGERVFRDAEARRDLEAIIHPTVQRAIDGWFASLDPARHPLAVADIPLLFETGRAADFDTVIVTICDGATQLKRIVERDRVTEDEALRRIAAQWPLEEKVHGADYVIRTDGTVADTNAQVRMVYERLKKTAAP